MVDVPPTSQLDEAPERDGKPAVRRRFAEPRLRVVVFTMVGHEYVVDVSQVQEIVRPDGLIHMAGAPAYVEGMIKRRGRIIPVMDLRKRLNLPVADATSQTCILVARMPPGPVGFLVDSVRELTWVNTSDFEVPSTVVAHIDEVFLQGVAHLESRLLVMLDLEQLLTREENHQLGTLDSTEPPDAGSDNGDTGDPNPEG